MYAFLSIYYDVMEREENIRISNKLNKALQPNEQGDVYRVGGTSALFPTRMPSCENENESI
jgi:hypothetical protein